MPATPTGADVADTAAGCAVKAGDTPEAKALLTSSLKRLESLAGGSEGLALGR